MADSDEGTDGWATRPQDTREQTCEYNGATPFSVMHSFRVARAPDPTTTTVARTYDVTVEWTATLDLPEFLASIAASCTPYGGDRFETGTGAVEPVEDERFRAAPVDATVRPPTCESPALSDPYHYWNTPLARLCADDHFSDGVTRLTLDLADGPDAVWADESIAGVPPERLPEDRTAYTRVGLEFTARERLSRGTDGEDRRSAWCPVGEPTPPDTTLLAPAVEATLAETVRRGGADSRSDPVATDVTDAIDAVESQALEVWSAFRWAADDRDGAESPFDVPEAAVETATRAPE